MTADAYGGVFPYSTELVGGLAAQGHEVHLALVGRAPTPDQRRLLSRSGAASVAAFESALEWMPDPWKEVDASCDWLCDLAHSLRPDVVHVNGYSHAAAPLGAPTVLVAHSCVLSWWWAVHGEVAPPRYGEYRERVANALGVASAVVAPSRFMLSELARWYGFAGGIVIPNCRSAGTFEPATKEPFVLGAGRIWDKAKNLNELARVASRLPWTVAVAGARSGPGETASLPEVGAARFLGELTADELAGVLGRAAIFAAPARYEPFGLAALEAGLSGCALVLGQISSFEEIWDDAALYVSPGGEEGLVEVVMRLIDDHALREHLGHAALRRALSFSPELCARRYEQVYSQVRSAAVR